MEGGYSLSSPILPPKRNLAAKQTTTAVPNNVPPVPKQIPQDKRNTATEVTSTMLMERVGRKEKEQEKGKEKKAVIVDVELAVTTTISAAATASSSSSSSQLTTPPIDSTVSDPSIFDPTVFLPNCSDVSAPVSKGVTKVKGALSKGPVLDQPVTIFGRVGRGKNKKYRNSIDRKSIVIVKNNGADTKDTNDCNETGSAYVNNVSNGVDDINHLNSSLQHPSSAGTLSYAAAASRNTANVNINIDTTVNISISDSCITAETHGTRKEKEEEKKKGMCTVEEKEIEKERNKSCASNSIIVAGRDRRKVSHALSDPHLDPVSAFPIVDKADSDTYRADNFIYSEEHGIMFAQEGGDGGLVKG